jgi:hypothetical protein
VLWPCGWCGASCSHRGGNECLRAPSTTRPHRATRGSRPLARPAPWPPHSMEGKSMLLAPSLHARIAPACAYARFRGPESRPPRAVLNLSHTKATLRPGPPPRQHPSLQALRMPCMASTMRLFCVIVNRPLGAFSRPCAATRRWAHAARRIFSRHDHTCPCHGGHSTRGTTSWSGTFLPSWGRTIPLKLPAQYAQICVEGSHPSPESSRVSVVAGRCYAIVDLAT